MKYFGTDGIRGKAFEGALSSENLALWGRAIATALLEFNTVNENLEIIIGRDTRESGNKITEILCDSIMKTGIDVLDAGVIPTPAVAFLTRFHKAHAGVVISASHNPFHDNGIKIFDADGFKASEQLEARIEEIFDTKAFAPFAESAGKFEKTGHAEYTDALIRRAGGENAFSKMRVYLDCANGAASEIAPELFAKLGCEVNVVAHNPDGKNINENCGAVHPEILAKLMNNAPGSLGVSFDGDADRAIYVDESGEIRDGDYWLYIVAKRLKDENSLSNNIVVGTIVTNLGLEISLEKLGIGFARTDVGDKYISRLMRQEDYVVGGEISGHYLMFAGDPKFTTGDGLLSTIELLKSMKYFNQNLAQLSESLEKMPQISLNVKVSSKPELETIPEIYSKIQEIESKSKGWGRIVFRYSGTEPVARIMVEGKPIDELEKMANELKSIVTQHIG